MGSWYSWWTGSLGTLARQRLDRSGDRDQNLEIGGGGSGGGSRGSYSRNKNKNLQNSETEGGGSGGGGSRGSYSRNKNKKLGHVGLIVGVTGMVGSRLAEILPRNDIPGGPWKVYGVARRPISPHHHKKNIQYIQCDLLDRDQTMEKISALTDVTHLFWVITNTGRGAEQTAENSCDLNSKMLSNVLDSLIPNAQSLEHVCLQTGSEHYLGSQDISGAMDIMISPHEVPFHETLPRLNNCSNFSYYTLEDVLFEKLGGQSEIIKISWSVHRPAVILLGFSPSRSSSMNLLASLAVYAAICKKQGAKFRFPGNSVTWEGLTDASDAELIAEQQLWACVEANGKNQAFNVTNGDVFRWKRLWTVLAEKLEVEPSDYDGRGFSMAEEMKEKSGVWEEIVKEKGLTVESSTVEECWGQWWLYVDRILNRNLKNGVSSMNKSKEYGFFGFRNTESSCLEWIDILKNHKIIP